MTKETYTLVSFFLAVLAAVWSAPLQAAGPLDRLVFSGDKSAEEHGVSGGEANMTRFQWRCGDRVIPLSGRTVMKGGTPLTFWLKTNTNRLLTVEIREFRTIEDSGLAYLVEVNGKLISLRSREYEGAGPTSGFIDIPNGLMHDRVLSVCLTNLAPVPVSFMEAILYSDLETYAQAEGMVTPLYVGPTAPLDRKRLSEVRRLLPDTPEVRPMFVLPTFAIAQWPPESAAERLDRAIAIARELNMPVELQLNTSWAGTPSGCDGAGGRWYDPIYQQVTYRPSTGEFALSVPNQWSSVPWLTTRHPRLNAYKARAFRTFGEILRRRAEASKEKLPILSLVLDNEVTYWGAGMPNTPPDLQADFNTSIIAAAKSEGVILDPRDGLNAEEMEFLRHSLRAYNREMLAGLRAGLGEGSLAERIYTHVFLGGWCFISRMQATEVGVLGRARLGGEWGGMTSRHISLLDQHRELGVPAGINDERNGGGGAANDVHFAYATGCHHLSLFNVSDQGLREIKESVAEGWHDFPPVPWRPTILREDFQKGDTWRKHFTRTEGVSVGVIWPGPMRALHGVRIGESGRALMRVTSQETIGKETFERLALDYEARAFVLRKATDEAYLVIRAGQRPDALREVDRLCNAHAPRKIDLTSIAQGSSEIYIEFEFHPLGLAGWVCLFKMALETPWAEERLLAMNRSYRADRLRCESAIVGWRADARWALQRAMQDLSSQAQSNERESILTVQQLLSKGAYRRAYELALDLLSRHAERPTDTWLALPSDREERGELRSTGGGYVAIDLYQDGFMGRRLRLAADPKLELEENGTVRRIKSSRELFFGDDIDAKVSDGRVTKLLARRGIGAGRVIAMTPVTAFALPTLTIEGQSARKISSVAIVRGRGESPKPASCWLEVGPLPFKIGDEVKVRWNPFTDRMVEVQLLTPR